MNKLDTLSVTTIFFFFLLSCPRMKMEELHGRSLSAGSSSSPKKQPTSELSNQFVSGDSGQGIQSQTAEKQAVIHDIGKDCSPFPRAVVSSELPRLENLDHANGEQIVIAKEGPALNSDTRDFRLSHINGATIRHTIDNLGSASCDSSRSFGFQQSEPAEKDPINVAGESALDKGTPMLSGKRKSPVLPSVSNRVLRSRSKEAPKATKSKVVEVEDTANESRKRKQRMMNGQMKNTPTNEFSKIRTHLRYLLHRIKYAQNLIDAYGEGWKGQSIEKLKPEKELQCARSQILRYKLKIRDLFQHLDRSLCQGKLPETLFDSEGQIDSEDIFCAKCGSKDLTIENDIILCDGACERGFHQFCLDPPLSKEDIPPDDEGWLCPECDCKVDCVEMLNDYQGSTLSVLDNWEKVFPGEAAAAASGKSLDDIDGLPSDDSEDDDYTPYDPGPENEVSGDESSSDGSDYFSASDDAVPSPDDKENLDLPSDDPEDDEYDPGSPGHDRHAKQESSASDFTSDSEDLGAILEDSESLGKDEGHALSNHCKPNAVSSGKKLKPGKMKRISLNDELSYLAGSNAVPLGKRQVERLDYKKLHDETYGDATPDSSDEDYEGTNGPKRQKSGAMQMFTNEIESRNKRKDAVDENENEDAHKIEGADNKLDVSQRSSSEAGSSGKNASRPYRRLGEAVTQKLLESFRENQYPKQEVKESLAKELGLRVKQVSKWFENARWSFHHSPRMESKMAGASSGNGTSTPRVNKIMSPGPAQSSLLQSPSCNGVENIASSQVNPDNEGCRTRDAGKGKSIKEEASRERGRRRKGKFNDQGSGAENFPMHDGSRVDTTKSQSQVLRKSSRIHNRNSKSIE